MLNCQTRVDMGLVNTKTTWLGVRIRDAYTSPEKEWDILTLRKNTCMCLYLEKRDTRFREKKVRLGAIRVDGMQSGELEGYVLLWLYKRREATQKQHVCGPKYSPDLSKVKRRADKILKSKCEISLSSRYLIFESY